MGGKGEGEEGEGGRVREGEGGVKEGEETMDEFLQAQL